MDAVNLQGIWLNFPAGVAGGGTPARAGVGGYYFYSVQQEARLRREQELLYRHFAQRAAARLARYRETFFRQQQLWSAQAQAVVLMEV